MEITRRKIIAKGAAAAAAAMTLPVVANATPPALSPEALEVARLFMLIDEDCLRACHHQMMRYSAGLEADPALRPRIRGEVQS